MADDDDFVSSAGGDEESDFNEPASAESGDDYDSGDDFTGDERPKKKAKKAAPKKAAAPKKRAPKKKKAAADDDDDGDDDDDMGDSPKKRAPAKAKAASGAKAAPKKASGGSASGAKAAKMSEADAPDHIVEYLSSENRPFNAINVFENLHGALSKPAVQRVLDKLADEGRIKSKTYGKTKIYYADQDQFGDVTPEAVAAADSEFKEVSARKAEVGARRAELEARVSDLQTALPDEQLEAEIAAMEVGNKELEVRLEAVRSGGPVITDEERKTMLAEGAKYRRAWSTRRTAVMEVVNDVCENMSLRPTDLMEEIGLDTDESTGVSLKEFKLE